MKSSESDETKSPAGDDEAQASALAVLVRLLSAVGAFSLFLLMRDSSGVSLKRFGRVSLFTADVSVLYATKSAA